MSVDELARLLTSSAFHFADERGLQDAIEAVLLGRGVPYEREFRLSPQDRIDFFCEGIGIEIKILSSPASVQRQLFRYAADPRIEALILATTKARHRSMPPEMLGKPVCVAYLLGSIF